MFNLDAIRYQQQTSAVGHCFFLQRLTPAFFRLFLVIQWNLTILQQNNVKNIRPVPGSELTTYQLGIPKHSDIFLKMCQPRPLLCLCLFLSTSILQKKMLTSGGFERGSSELKTRMLTTSPLPRHYLHSDTFYKLLKQRINSIEIEFKIGKIT